ncbi:MAG: hypothetical protein DI585_04460 [Pseudomonas fluorescens]|nr:MAG: hypothetical protein DI585_04460 [Pseudomonas fluorescens]
MQMRPVPRNIDRPNRMPEYAVSFLGTYYLMLFLTGKSLVGLVLGGLAMYLMYKLTLDKPEGLTMRMLYRHLQFGAMRPTPRFCKKLEV